MRGSGFFCILTSTHANAAFCGIHMYVHLHYIVRICTTLTQNTSMFIVIARRLQSVAHGMCCVRDIACVCHVSCHALPRRGDSRDDGGNIDAHTVRTAAPPYAVLIARCGVLDSESGGRRATERVATEAVAATAIALMRASHNGGA